MTAEPHCPAIEASGPEPPEVPVGAAFVLKVRLVCPAGCDLASLPIAIAAPDGKVTVVDRGGEGADIRSIAQTAPPTVGEHVWRLSVAPQEVAGAAHAPCALPVAIRTRPQPTSLAVWAIPSPVVTGQSFAIKAGAKSAAGCDLAGRTIIVRDEGGAVMASGSLGATPWPDTDALYWTELRLPAPAKAGMFSWSVKFDATGLALPHEGASSRFSIAIVDPPEHRLTVKVIERETAAPVADAKVRLGAYRGATGPSGLAEIMLPKGAYDLTVWRPGYEAAPSAVTIEADATIEVTVSPVPEDNPDAAWLM
jgi:hypothetical protein